MEGLRIPWANAHDSSHRHSGKGCARTSRQLQGSAGGKVKPGTTAQFQVPPRNHKKAHMSLQASRLRPFQRCRIGCSRPQCRRQTRLGPRFARLDAPSAPHGTEIRKPGTGGSKESQKSSHERQTGLDGGAGASSLETNSAKLISRPASLTLTHRPGHAPLAHRLRPRRGNQVSTPGHYRAREPPGVAFRRHRLLRLAVPDMVPGMGTV